MENKVFVSLQVDAQQIQRSVLVMLLRQFVYR